MTTLNSTRYGASGSTLVRTTQCSQNHRHEARLLGQSPLRDPLQRERDPLSRWTHQNEGMSRYPMKGQRQNGPAFPVYGDKKNRKSYIVCLLQMCEGVEVFPVSILMNAR